MADSRYRTKQVVEEIREPLEQCRAILRILNVFGDKKDSPLKDDFLKIYKETTETIKNQKTPAGMSLRDLQLKVQQIDGDLQILRAKLDPRLEEVKNLLQLTSLNEILEYDSQTFGILLRLMEVNNCSGTSNQLDPRIEVYAKRAYQASATLGGKQSLKRGRFQHS